MFRRVLFWRPQEMPAPPAIPSTQKPRIKLYLSGPTWQLWECKGQRITKYGWGIEDAYDRWWAVVNHR